MSGGGGGGGGGGGEKKKQTILDLSKYMDKHIHVKFQGGREASGILKGELSNRHHFVLQLISSFIC